MAITRITVQTMTGGLSELRRPLPCPKPAQMGVRAGRGVFKYLLSVLMLKQQMEDAGDLYSG